MLTISVLSLFFSSVRITSALLLHSNLSNSHIHNAHSVETQKLIVKDIAEFYSDVVIDGSVTIHGTVIGKFNLR